MPPLVVPVAPYFDGVMVPLCMYPYLCSYVCLSVCVCVSVLRRRSISLLPSGSHVSRSVGSVRLVCPFALLSYRGERDGEVM